MWWCRRTEEEGGGKGRMEVVEGEKKEGRMSDSLISSSRWGQWQKSINLIRKKRWWNLKIILVVFCGIRQKMQRSRARHLGPSTVPTTPKLQQAARPATELQHVVVEAMQMPGLTLVPVRGLHLVRWPWKTKAWFDGERQLLRCEWAWPEDRRTWSYLWPDAADAAQTDPEMRLDREENGNQNVVGWLKKEPDSGAVKKLSGACSRAVAVTARVKCIQQLTRQPDTSTIMPRISWDFWWILLLTGTMALPKSRNGSNKLRPFSMTGHLLGSGRGIAPSDKTGSSMPPWRTVKHFLVVQQASPYHRRRNVRQHTRRGVRLLGLSMVHKLAWRRLV